MGCKIQRNMGYNGKGEWKRNQVYEMYSVK